MSDLSFKVLLLDNQMRYKLIKKIAIQSQLLYYSIIQLIMFHRHPSKSQRKSFIPPIPGRPSALQEITNVVAAKYNYQPGDTENESKKKYDKIPSLDNGKAIELNNIIQNNLPNKNVYNFCNEYSNYQADQKQNCKPINSRSSFQKRKQYHERSRSFKERNYTKNCINLPDQCVLGQIEKKDNSLAKRNLEQERKSKQNGKTQNVDCKIEESQHLFKVRKTSVTGTNNRCTDIHRQNRQKVQSGYIKYTPESYVSISFQQRCQIVAQIYKKSQIWFRRISSQRKKSLSKDSSVNIFKNQLKNQPFCAFANQNKQYDKLVFQADKRIKPIDTSKSDSNKIVCNNITKTPNSKNFIIKSKSKGQVNNINYAYLQTEDFQIAANRAISHQNRKQNNVQKYNIIESRKRSTTTSSKNVQGTNKQIIYCNYLKEKSENIIEKETQNVQSVKKLECDSKNGIIVSRNTVDQIITKTQEKQRQRILKEIETTQSIKCIMEEVNNNRKLKSSRFHNDKSSQDSHKQKLNFDKQTDSEPKSQISIILEQLNQFESVHVTQRQSAKEDYIEKGFPKKNRRNYVGGCKIRRVEWGKSKQKDKVSDKVLDEMQFNIQDFYTPPLDQSQIKREIESEFRKQCVKINTINLFQQLVVNGEMSLAISNIAHDENDETPLQSLQQLYRQL